MLTAQEVQSIHFEKAVFGGYDAQSVNEFIEQVAEDFAILQKENAALKAKMKVLVDKIDEYRSVEDGMRRALVSAQSIAQETVDKAKLEAEQLANASKEKADMQHKEHLQMIQAEAQRLDSAKQQSSAFITKMIAYHEEQMKNLITLSTSTDLQPSSDVVATTFVAPVVTPAEKATPTVSGDTRDLTEEIQEPATQEPNKEYAIPEDIRQFMNEQQTSENGLKVKVMGVTVNPDAQEDEKPNKSKFRFGELKFGAEYSPENDR